MTTLLLSSVFGPFGVDDAYGRKENIMELFHNQVTREQGMFSLRLNHPSFGLHLLAANVEASTKVLDFPSQKRFIEEIKRGYDYVGISFITPNFVKAKRMAQLVRQHAPNSKIILGGHGTRIPEIQNLISYDHICHGEGVSWLRRLLGEDPTKKIRHPSIASALNKRIVGVPRPIDAAVLIPGVGCPNACRFCATSHFFDRSYTPFFETGDALFEVCQDIERDLGVTEFFVMDENFLKYRERAERFVELLETRGKDYCFGIFSSAETIKQVGVEFLVRLGVYFLWLGVESKKETYEKNRGVDFPALVKELRDAGISVLSSGILFSEHHDKQTIHDDIDFMVSLNSDYVQFMELGPLPQTALYKEYRDKGLLLDQVPYEEWHGQDKIWFRHEHFERDETREIIKQAFIKDYQVNGPSILRLVETAVRGALSLRGRREEMLVRRYHQLLKRCREYRPLLTALRHYAPSENAKQHVKRVEHLYQKALGPKGLGDRARALAIEMFATREYINVALNRAMYQPPTIETTYHWTEQTHRRVLSIPAVPKLANKPVG